jgi:mono/diheme cytochrome c family protein
MPRGRDIVNGICIGCHGSPPTGAPETVLGEATRIVAAFDKRPPIASLRGVLTPADVSDAAEYLLSLEGELPNAIPAHDASDLWWNAAESGWGFGVNQHASNNITKSITRLSY